VGVDELFDYFKAVLLCVAMLTIAIGLIYDFKDYSPVIFILFGVYLFLGLTATRSSFRILDQISNRRTRQEEQRVIICGAGDAGEMAVRWIQMNPQLNYRPIGFLDKDSLNKGRHIHGIEILGGYALLKTILEQEKIDGLIITASEINSEEFIQEILPICHERKCWVRTLKLEFDLVE